MRSLYFTAIVLCACTALAASGPDSIQGPASSGSAFRAGERAWPCPEDALFGQSAHECWDGWNAVTSGIFQGYAYKAYENLPPYIGQVCGLQFYGLSSVWLPGWEECDPSSGLVLELTFYADANGAPGDVICGPTIALPSHTLVEDCFGFLFYRFEVSALEPCCELTGASWISIQSVDGPDCIFLWMSSGTGDGLCYQDQNGVLMPVSNDLAVCLLGTYTPHYGACCDDLQGLCEGNIDMQTCVSAGKRWQEGVACADMSPLCGYGTGACCYDDGWCLQTAKADCGQVGDVNCDGNVDFGDINPFVAVLSGGVPCNPAQVDCNRDGKVGFGDINPFVAIIAGSATPLYGAFAGFSTTCNDCPCVAVPCPAGATPEDEPCYTDTNGGCNSTPPVFGSITCGETVCGTSFQNDELKDTDWFLFEAHEGYSYTITYRAEFDMGGFYLFRDNFNDCANEDFWYWQFPACEEHSVKFGCMAPSFYYIWIGPLDTPPFECTDESAQYWVRLDCEPCELPLGACCRSGSCYPNMAEADCASEGGQWQGDGVECTPDLCPPPQLGELCATALPVTDPLPFADLGSTCGFTNDYDEACDVPAYAPDIVYAYTPSTDTAVSVSLCFDETDYDSKIFVYEDACPGPVVGCNDDYCSTASFPYKWVSQIEEVQLRAGHTYFFVIDGYDAECGIYHLQIGAAAVGACCLSATECVDEMTPTECATAGGYYQGNATVCAAVTCPAPPPNDLCENAQAVAAPYPVTILGTCVNSYADCPDELGSFNAVWYQVELPYANNILAVNFCGTAQPVDLVGAVCYLGCPTEGGAITCADYVFAWDAVWNECSYGGTTGVEVTWGGLAGPGFAYLPAVLNDPFGELMEFNATFTVTELIAGAQSRGGNLAGSRLLKAPQQAR